jgi:hypothetical protein
VRVEIDVVEVPGSAPLAEMEIGRFQDIETLAGRPPGSQPASILFQQVSSFQTLFSSREDILRAVARSPQISFNFFDRGQLSAEA